MITIIELLDKLTEIWPYATQGEKQAFSDAFYGGGGVVAIYWAYEQLCDNVTKRVGGNK